MNDSLWIVVLAGDESAGRGPLTRAVDGDDCPEQLVVIAGARSMLQEPSSAPQPSFGSKETIVLPQSGAIPSDAASSSIERPFDALEANLHGCVHPRPSA